TNRARLNFAAAGFKIVHDFINELLEGKQTGGAFFESFGDAAGELAPIERLLRAVALDHAEIGALDFLVSGETIAAFETLAPPANARAIARLSGIDYLVITRAALGATHSVKAYLAHHALWRQRSLTLGIVVAVRRRRTVRWETVSFAQAA